MEPEAKGCKLQNFYDAQTCALAIICILIGAVVCFYGKSEYYHYQHKVSVLRTPIIDIATQTLIYIIYDTIYRSSLKSDRGFNTKTFYKKGLHLLLHLHLLSLTFFPGIHFLKIDFCERFSRIFTQKSCGRPLVEVVKRVSTRAHRSEFQDLGRFSVVPTSRVAWF